MSKFWKRRHKKEIEFDNCRIRDIPSSVSTPAASTCLPLPLSSRMMKHGKANRREGRPPCSPAYDRQTGVEARAYRALGRDGQDVREMMERRGSGKRREMTMKITNA